MVDGVPPGQPLAGATKAIVRGDVNMVQQQLVMLQFVISLLPDWTSDHPARLQGRSGRLALW